VKVTIRPPKERVSTSVTVILIALYWFFAVEFIFPILSKRLYIDIPLAQRINSHYFFVKVAIDLFSVALCIKFQSCTVHGPSILRNTMKQTSRIFSPCLFSHPETSCNIMNCVGTSISRPISPKIPTSQHTR